MARECSARLRLVPPLHWEQVRDFIEPQMLAMENRHYARYDDQTRDAIARYLLRESQRLSVWRKWS